MRVLIYISIAFQAAGLLGAVAGITAWVAAVIFVAACSAQCFMIWMDKSHLAEIESYRVDVARLTTQVQNLASAQGFTA